MQDLGDYSSALSADKAARAALRWSGPIIVFGWFILVLAGVLFVVMALASALSANRYGEFGPVFVTVLGSLLVSALVAVFVALQASVVLAVGYYIRMRAHMTVFRVSTELSAD